MEKRHTVSTRAERHAAVEMVKKAITAGKPVSEAQVYKATNVTRILHRLTEAGAIKVHEKTNKMYWATDSKVDEIVTVCWRNFGADAPEPVPVNPASALVEKIGEALQMIDTYNIENKAEFIADMLIKSKIKL